MYKLSSSLHNRLPSLYMPVRYVLLQQARGRLWNPLYSLYRKKPRWLTPHQAVPDIPVLQEHIRDLAVAEFLTAEHGSLGHCLGGAAAQFEEEVFAWIAQRVGKA